MMQLHLAAVSVLGFSLLWSLKLVYGRRETASDDVLVLVSSIAAWVLIFLGLAFMSSPPVMIVGLIVAAMIVARYRDSERRALLWTLAVAAEKGLSLSTAARSFAAGRIDEVGRRAAKLAELLEAGIPLTKALQQSHNPLPRDAQLAANIGIATDSLASTLRQAARDGDHLDSISHGAWAHLMYFVVMINIMVALMGFLLIKVIPTYEVIFADFDMELPGLTKLGIRLAQTVARNGFLLAPVWLSLNAVLVYTVLGYMGTRLPQLRVLDWWFGPRDTPILLQALEACILQGRPIPEAIGLLAHGYPTSSVAKKLTQSAAQIRAGRHWCDSLVQQGLLKSSEAAVLKSAERVDNLPWALHELSQIAARRISDRATALCQLLSPLIVLVIAVPIALFAVAFIIPLISLVTNLSV
jgi:type IV pilus assembly protein PilC